MNKQEFKKSDALFKKYGLFNVMSIINDILNGNEEGAQKKATLLEQREYENPESECLILKLLTN